MSPPFNQRWGIDFTPEAEAWYKALSPERRSQMSVAISQLQREGPNLGRPFVDSIKGSRHHNMKELRSTSTNQRALFAFGRDRRAVVLVGGDKTGKWNGWYRSNIPRAEKLYDRYLRNGGKEPPCGPSPQRAGRPSGPRTR
jgi:hypothetical protein